MESESKTKIKDDLENLEFVHGPKAEENGKQSMNDIDTETVAVDEIAIVDQKIEPDLLRASDIEPAELIMQEDGQSTDLCTTKVEESKPADVPHTEEEINLPRSVGNYSNLPVIDYVSDNHSASGSHQHSEECTSGITLTDYSVSSLVEPNVMSVDNVDLSFNSKEWPESETSNPLRNIEDDPQKFVSRLNSKGSKWKEVDLVRPAETSHEEASEIKEIKAEEVELAHPAGISHEEASGIKAEEVELARQAGASNEEASEIIGIKAEKVDLALPAETSRETVSEVEEVKVEAETMDLNGGSFSEEAAVESVENSRADNESNVSKTSISPEKMDLTITAEDPVYMQDMDSAEKLQYIDFRQDGMPPGKAFAKINQIRREKGMQDLIYRKFIGQLRNPRRRKSKIIFAEINKTRRERGMKNLVYRKFIEQLRNPRKLKINLNSDEQVTFQNLRESGLSREEAFARIEKLRVQSQGSGLAEHLHHPNCADCTNKGSQNQKVSQEDVETLNVLKKQKRELHKKFMKFDRNQKRLHLNLRKDGLSHPDAVNKVLEVTRKIGEKNIRFVILETLFSSRGPGISVSASLERFLSEESGPGTSSRQVQVSSTTNASLSSASGASNRSTDQAITNNTSVTAETSSFLEEASKHYPEYGDFFLGLQRCSNCEHSLDELVRMAQRIPEDHGIYGRKLFILRCFQFGVDPAWWNWSLYSAVPSGPKMFPQSLPACKPILKRPTPQGQWDRPSCLHSSCKYFSLPVAASGVSFLKQLHPDHRTTNSVADASVGFHSGQFMADQNDSPDPVGVQSPHQMAVPRSTSRAEVRRKNLPDESSSPKRSRCVGEPFTDPHIAGTLPSPRPYSSSSGVPPQEKRKTVLPRPNDVLALAEYNTKWSAQQPCSRSTYVPEALSDQQPGSGVGAYPTKTPLRTPNELLAWAESTTKRTAQQSVPRSSYTAGQFRPPQSNPQYTSFRPSMTVPGPSSCLKREDSRDLGLPKRSIMIKTSADPQKPGETPNYEHPSSSGDTLHLYIVSSRYPNKLLNDEEMHEIENGILDAILKIHDNQMRPAFKGSYHNNGRYEVICQDQFSKEWIYKYISCLKEEWPNVSLKIIPAEPSKVIRPSALLPEYSSYDEYETQDAKELYASGYGISSGSGSQEQEGYREGSEHTVSPEPLHLSRRNLQERLGPKIESREWGRSRYIELSRHNVPRQEMDESSLLESSYSSESRYQGSESEYVDQSWDVHATSSMQNTRKRFILQVEVVRSPSPQYSRYIEPPRHDVPRQEMVEPSVLRSYGRDDRDYGRESEYIAPPQDFLPGSSVQNPLFNRQVEVTRRPSPGCSRSRDIETTLHDTSGHQACRSSLRSYSPDYYGENARYFHPSSSNQDRLERYNPDCKMTRNWSPEYSHSRQIESSLHDASRQEVDGRFSGGYHPVQTGDGEPGYTRPSWYDECNSSNHYRKRHVLELSTTGHSRRSPSPVYSSASDHSGHYESGLDRHYRSPSPGEPSRSDARERLRQIRSNRIPTSVSYVEKDCSSPGTSYSSHSQYHNRSPPLRSNQSCYRKFPSRR